MRLLSIRAFPLGALAAAICAIGFADPRAQSGQPQAASDVVELRADVPTSGTLRPGATTIVEIPAEAETFVQLRVDGGGTRLRVSLVGGEPSDAGGAATVRVRTAGDRTPITWSTIVRSAGRLVLRVESAETDAERPFAVRLLDRRSSAPQDTERLEAERLLELTDGDRLAHGTAALALAERTEDVPLQARALLRVGTVHADAGHTAEAEQTMRVARTRCATPAAACEAEAELAIGRLLAATGRPDLGLAAFTAALSAAEARSDTATTAEALLERGGLEISKAQQDRARATLTQAAEMARVTGHRRAEADAKNMLGILAANLGDADASEQGYTAALALRRAIGDEAGQAQTESNLGALANTMGEYRRALGYFDDALATRRRLGLAQATANTLHNLGVAHANLGALETALGHLEEALGIWKKTGGRRGEAFALQELGQTYARLGDRMRALEYWRRARPLWTAIGDRRGELQTVLFAAATEADDGAAGDAASSYTAALELARTAKLRREEGLARLGLAGVARRRGALDEALVHAGHARAIFDAIPNRREHGRALAEIGDIHLQASRLVEARVALGDALLALDAVEDRAEVGRVAVTLAEVAARQGDAAVAVASLDRALERLESVRREQLAESFNLSVFASDRPYYDQAIAMLMRLHRNDPTAGFDGRAFSVSERRRARRLLDLVSGTPVTHTDDAGRDVALRLRRSEERIGAKATRLTRLLSDAPPPARVEAAREELRQLVEGADRLRAELQRRHLTPLNDPVVLDAAGVQARLGPGAVLLEYAIGDRAGVGWAVTSTQVLAFEVPGRDRLEPLVRGFLDEVSGRLDASVPAAGARRTTGSGAPGQALSTALLGPAATLLAHSSHLVLVGDGPIDALPFAALPQPGTRVPLAVQLRVDTVPSASVAAALRARRQDRQAPQPRIAVFADPVYSAADGRLPSDRRKSGDAADLLRLRFSREEARAIERYAPSRTTLFLDFDAARERALDGSLADYRYLHLASHARIDETVPQLSTIELSRVDARGRPRIGALRLIDVYGLSLNAELVVLSACGTALGAPIGGEGLVGFASGFLRAGADRVVASLWDVDDAATAAFMGRFYDGLLREHLTSEAAFHRAQRIIRGDPRWRHTRHWAAWVLVGPGDVTNGPPDRPAPLP